MADDTIDGFCQRCGTELHKQDPILLAFGIGDVCEKCYYEIIDKDLASTLSIDKPGSAFVKRRNKIYSILK